MVKAKVIKYVLMPVLRVDKREKDNNGKGYKQVSEKEVNIESYSKDIDLGDEEKQELSEYWKDHDTWQLTDRKFLSKEPLINFPGVYPGSRDIAAKLKHYRIAVSKELKLDLLKALNRFQEKNNDKSPITTSLIEYKGEKYTIDELSDKLAKEIIDSINSGESEVKIEGMDSGEKQESENPAGVPPEQTQENPETNPEEETKKDNELLEQDMKKLEKLSAKQFPINWDILGETEIKNVLDTDSDPEVRVTPRFKVEKQPHLESKPYLETDNVRKEYESDILWAIQYFYGL